MQSMNDGVAWRGMAWRGAARALTVMTFLIYQPSLLIRSPSVRVARLSPFDAASLFHICFFPPSRARYAANKSVSVFLGHPFFLSQSRTACFLRVFHSRSLSSWDPHPFIRFALRAMRTLMSTRKKRLHPYRNGALAPRRTRVKRLRNDASAPLFNPLPATGVRVSPDPR